MRYVLILLLLQSCVLGPATVAPTPLTLVYSGNLDGELEPCGCSEGGNKGGIKRRAQKLDELRNRHEDMVLISAGGLLVSELPQDQLKSDYILQGLAQQSYDAVGVQWRDLAYGDLFLQKYSLPWVLSNWDDKGFAHKRRILRSGNRVLTYFQWLEPRLDPQKDMGGTAQLLNNAQALLVDLKTAKLRNETTILATTLPLKLAQRQFDLSYVDILLVKASYEVYGEPQRVNNTLVLQPGSRGMRLGELQLVLDQHGGIANWEHRVHALPPEVADAPRMNAWYEAYNAAVKKQYQQRAAMRKQMEKGESPFATAQSCQACHASAFSAWQSSAHSEAFYKLQDVNKAFDPNCIACHTLGFEKAGGFIDAMFTPQHSHVQCENCHGAAKAHAQSAGKQQTANHDWQPAQMCAQCHVQKHSPDFDFQQYWPRIKHGHG